MGCRSFCVRTALLFVWVAPSIAFAQSFTRRDDLITALQSDVVGQGEYKDIDFGDVNGDGLLDAMLVKSRGNIHDALLLNACSSGSPPCPGNAGQFVYVENNDTTAATLPIDVFVPGTSKTSYDSDLVDLDRDGRLDYLRMDTKSTVDGTNRIRFWMNRTCTFDATTCPYSFHFVDETATRIGPEPADFGHDWDDADFADVNEDGYVDIIVGARAHEQPPGENMLLINRGAAAPGSFVIVRPAAFTPPRPLPWGSSSTHDVEFGDVNNDGWVDIIFSKDAGGGDLMQRHTGRLQSATIGGVTVQVPIYEEVAIPGSTGSYTGELFDYDGDGDVDWFSGNGG